MVKKETLKLYVEKSNGELTAKEVEKFLSVQDLVVEHVITGQEKAKLGEAIQINGEAVEEREGRNPSTGESLVIPAHIKGKVKLTKNYKKF